MSRIPSPLPFVVTLACGAAAWASDSAVLTDYGRAPAATSVQPLPQPPHPSPRGADAAQAKAVDWLLRHQQADGGWASGAHGSDGSQASSDVATTAYVVLALKRDDPSGVRHRDAMTRGVRYVLQAVRTAPPGPRLNTAEGTQIQVKLGPLVDTHLAGLMLGEMVDALDPTTNREVRAALDVVMSKVSAAQRTDGSFDGTAWAPVLSTAIAAQGLDRALAVGASVSTAVVAKSDAYQVAQGASADTSAAAGVPLYAVASSLANNAKTAGRGGVAAPAASVRADAQAAAEEGARTVARDTGALVAGFGSLGGEEMLSYMMISDTLAAKGGPEFNAWEARIADILVAAQDQEGSWAGHHCITSRAFATAGGVMTLAAADMASWRRTHPRG